MSKPRGVTSSYDTPLTPEQATDYNRWRATLPPALQNTADYDLQGAYLASAQVDGRAHMTDQFKKPNHMTFSEGSQYSTQQTQGGKWTAAGDGSYVFWASPYNVQMHPLLEMQKYFSEVEPGNIAVANIPYFLRSRN